VVKRKVLRPFGDSYCQSPSP